MSITSTIIGVILAVIGCIFQAIGFIVQKIAHNKLEIENKLREDNRQKTYVSSKTWILGFILNAVVGTLLNAIALNYAPQSLVLPLSSITMLGNTILAVLVLKEPFHLYDGIGTLLVIIGTLFAIIYGPRQGSRRITIDYLLNRWNDIVFLCFFWIVSLIYIIDLICVKILENKIQKHNELVTKKHIKKESQNDRNMMNNVGNIKRLSVSYLQEDVNELRQVIGIKNLWDFSDYNLFLVSYASLSGFCASISFLFLKSTLELVSSAFANRSLSAQNFGSGKSWYTYTSIILLIFVNILLVYFQQRALSSFNSLYVIPIFQVTVILLGTSLGAIFFDELLKMKPQNFIIFVLSVLITAAGVIVLAFVPKNKNKTLNLKNQRTSNRLSIVEDNRMRAQSKSETPLETRFQDELYMSNIKTTPQQLIHVPETSEQDIIE